MDTSVHASAFSLCLPKPLPALPRLREEWATFSGGLSRKHPPQSLSDWLVLGGPLIGAVSCIFNPVSWGSHGAHSSTMLPAGPG